MAYSEVGDMLTGNIPVGSTSAQKYVNDAADEIDSVIGNLYVTPLDMSDPSPLSRPSRLLLKRISNFLASGRLMFATSAGGEDDQLHAYARYLVETATATLMRIANGEIFLDGAIKEDIDGESGSPGPLISNVDFESNVEAFYDRIFMAPPNLGLIARRSGG